MEINNIKEQPLVSVIIPNYNHAKYLKERIDSVLEQTYENFEVIILDDCSTDNSRDIIENYRYNHKISHIVYNQDNSGSTFKQWQKGFTLAKGEYIWIAESDDVADIHFLEKLINAIDFNKYIVLAASAIVLIDEEGNKIGSASISKSKRARFYKRKSFITENMLLGNHVFNASSVIFRKDVLNNISHQYASFKASGDYLFWIEVANQGNVVEIPDKLDFFRKSSISVTPRLYASGKAFEEAIIVYKRLIELGYAKGIFQHIIIGFRLWQLRNIKLFSSDEIKNQCIKSWKSETRTPRLDMFICCIYGAYRKFKRLIRNS